MFLMKADANRNSITKILSRLFYYFHTLSISQLVSLFSSNTFLKYTGNELENKRNLIVKKQASEQFSRKMTPTCSFPGAA